MMRAMVVRVELAEAVVVGDPTLRDLLDDTERARSALALIHISEPTRRS